MEKTSMSVRERYLREREGESGREGGGGREGGREGDI